MTSRPRLVPFKRGAPRVGWRVSSAVSLQHARATNTRSLGSTHRGSPNRRRRAGDGSINSTAQVFKCCGFTLAASRLTKPSCTCLLWSRG